MWIVMYNGITGECYCEPLTEYIEGTLALQGWTVPNDAWFII